MKTSKTSSIRSFARSIAAVVTLTAATVAATGCAVDAKDAPADVETAAAPLTDDKVSAKLNLDPEAILEDMAKALAGAASKELEKKLFPESSIDVNKLLASFDQSTRQALIDEAMRKDSALLDASTIFLKRIEGERDGKGAAKKTNDELYDEVIHNNVLNNVDVVIAGVGGESARIGIKRAGLRLYVLANQINANRYMLQMQLRPRTADSDRTALVEMLRTGRAHVLKIVNDFRSEELALRMATLSECFIYEDSADLGQGRTYRACFNDKTDNKCYGDQQSGDAEVALGKCEYWRDGHIQKLDRVRTEQLNAMFAFELKMADEWAKSADSLEKKSAAESTLTNGLDFGGMWGFISVNGKTVASNNPFTGAPSCPAGYDDTMVVGKMNIDWPLHMCTRPANGVAEPVADFGGMYGNMDYREQRFTSKNPFTSQGNCPAGFAATKVLGDGGADNDLWMCAKAHVPGTKTAHPFGGAYSRKAGYSNPASDGKSCTTGFVPVQVWGSNGDHGHKRDEALVICVLP